MLVCRQRILMAAGGGAYRVGRNTCSIDVLPATRSSDAVRRSAAVADDDDWRSQPRSMSSSRSWVPRWMAERKSNSAWSDGVLTCGFDHRPPVSTFSSYLIHLQSHTDCTFIDCINSIFSLKLSCLIYKTSLIRTFGLLVWASSTVKRKVSALSCLCCCLIMCVCHQNVLVKCTWYYEVTWRAPAT